MNSSSKTTSHKVKHTVVWPRGLKSPLPAVLWLTRMDRKDLQGLKLHKLFQKLRSASCSSDAERKHPRCLPKSHDPLTWLSSCDPSRLTERREGGLFRDAVIKCQQLLSCNENRHYNIWSPHLCCNLACPWISLACSVSSDIFIRDVHSTTLPALHFQHFKVVLNMTFSNCFFLVFSLIAPCSDNNTYSRLHCVCVPNHIFETPLC